MAHNAMFFYFYNLLLSRDAHFESAEGYYTDRDARYESAEGYYTNRDARYESAEGYYTNRDARYKKEEAYCIKTGACSNFTGANYIKGLGA